MDKQKSKMYRCQYHYPELDGTHLCIYGAYGAKTIGDIGEFKKDTDKETCENCELFKSKYIEYPVMVNDIKYKDIAPYNVKPSLAKVRLCEDDKTYLGIYLGEFPHFPHSSLSEDGILTFGAACNPCIYVPELEKVVWGSESWWSKIDDASELKDITDEDIENTWYVKLLRAMQE